MADADVDYEDQKQSRFAHLMKPIRDLQDSFSIDLAHELEEYLELLENATFTFDGSPNRVDFAEAAIIIQNSTNTFSKKVEYLYCLTYQALEAVKGRRKEFGPDGQPLDGDAPAQQAPGPRGRAARVAAEEDDDSVARFWQHSSYMREVDDLDLAAGEGDMPNAGSVVRPPAAFLALEDQGQGAANNGTSGKAGDGDSGVYRLQQCAVHCSGALLLDPREGDLYDNMLRFIGPQPRRDKGLEELIAAHRVEQPTQPWPQSATQPHMPGPAQQPAGAADGAAAAPMDVDQGQMHGDDNDDGGAYDGGGDWPSDDEGAPAAAAEDDGGMDPAAKGATSEGEGGAAATEEYADGRPKQRIAASAGQIASGSMDGGGQGRPEEEEEAEEEREYFDPYKPLDPFVKGRLPDRPLVVRKPRKLASHGRGRTDGAVARCGTSLAAGSGLLQMEFSYCLGFLRPGPAAKAQEEAVPEQVAKRTATKQQRVSRLDRVEKVHRPGLDAAAPVFDADDAAAAVAADEAAAADPADEFQERPYDFDDDNGGGDFGGGGGSDLDDVVDPAAAGPGGHAGDAGTWYDHAGDADGAGDRPGSRSLWPGMVPPMGGLGGGPDGGMAMDGEEATYEELCRAHMESMFMAAAAREVQSDLARRVNGWRQRIDPLLKAEESRPAFDIQDYGELILHRLKELKVTDGSPAGEQAQQQEPLPEPQARPHVSFSVVAADLQKFEVSRMFSAMLQLINNRNVAIFRVDAAEVPPGEVPDEPFRLELLDTQMYHKTMGEQLALPKRKEQQAGDRAPPAVEGGDVGEHDDGENRGATQPPAAKRGSGGRGKQGGGGTKRAKRAVAEPLVDVNADD